MGKPTSSIRLTLFQTQVAIGTLLGDSSLSRPKGGKNFHLSCYHAIKQKEWLIQKHAWLSPATSLIQWCAYADKRDGKIREGGRFHSVSIPCFTRLAGMLYDENRVKIIRDDLLAIITDPVALACLICDDGSWDGAGIAIALKQFTIEENERFAAFLLTQFRLNCGIITSGKYPCLRITAASVEATRHLCFPFVPETLRYKFGPDDYKTSLVGKIEKQCEQCRESFLSYESVGQVFCSQECANIAKPRGYEARVNTVPIECVVCHSSFVPYNRKVNRCKECREKKITNIPCAVCGNPIKTPGRATCSYRCSAIHGHSKRNKTKSMFD